VEAYGEYCSSVKCRTKIPAIFRGVFGILRGISKLLFVYSTTPRGPLTMFCGTMVRKHCNRPKTTSIILCRTTREEKWERIEKEAGIPKKRLRKIIETSDTSQ
jgi:hypothetical protein